MINNSIQRCRYFKINTYVSILNISTSIDFCFFSFESLLFSFSLKAEATWKWKIVFSFHSLSPKAIFTLKEWKGYYRRPVRWAIPKKKKVEKTYKDLPFGKKMPSSSVLCSWFCLLGIYARAFACVILHSRKHEYHWTFNLCFMFRLNLFIFNYNEKHKTTA